MTPGRESRLVPIGDSICREEVLAAVRAMNALSAKKIMKRGISTVLIATVFVLTSVSVGHAKSELLSLSTEAVWPTSSKPDSNLVYTVTTVGRGGAGLLEVTLTAGNMPPGVTVTFDPPILRFTGNQVTSQTATMTVHCSTLIPVDCYPFTLTGTSQNESITVTNTVMFSPFVVMTRLATLYLDNQGNGAMRLRGLGATGKNYQVEATSSLSVTWTPLGGATADANGRFTFFPTQTNGPARFFRAVEVGP